MSVTSVAHQLARALADSAEYARLQAARKAVEERQAAQIMLEDARRQEIKLRDRHARGEEISEAELDDLQKTMELVSFNPYVRELLEAEYALGQLLTEIWGIVSAGVGIEPPEEDEQVAAETTAPGSEPTVEKGKSRLWVPGQNM